MSNISKLNKDNNTVLQTALKTMMELKVPDADFEAIIELLLDECFNMDAYHLYLIITNVNKEAKTYLDILNSITVMSDNDVLRLWKQKFYLLDVVSKNWYSKLPEGAFDRYIEKNKIINRLEEEMANNLLLQNPSSNNNTVFHAMFNVLLKEKSSTVEGIILGYARIIAGMHIEDMRKWISLKNNDNHTIVDLLQKIPTAHFFSQSLKSDYLNVFNLAI
jgi:hypothetical protein